MAFPDAPPAPIRTPFGSIKEVPLEMDPVWQRWFTRLQMKVQHIGGIYDVIFSLQGLPPLNTTYPVVVFELQVTFPIDFSGSEVGVLTKPTAPATYTVKKNGITVGTVVIAADGTFAFSSTVSEATVFSIGDMLTITTPNPQDATLADVAITLAGIR